MCECTKLDRIINGVIREKARAAPIEEKTTDTGLRWLGHVRGGV